MMNPEVMRTRLGEIRARHNDLTAELANLDARAAGLGESDREKYVEPRSRLEAGIEALEGERRQLEQGLEERERCRQELARAVETDVFRGQPLETEAGTPFGEPDARREQPARSFAEQTRQEAHSAAMRAVERNAPQMHGDRPAELEEALRRDHGGLGTRYLAAVGSEDYRSAFGVWLAHPQDAHLRMTPRQAEAMREAHQAAEQRALAEGTGSTGGFGVPLALDPTIMLSSAGVANPIRSLATVTTIATSEWKGVTSAGITASFDAEATEVSDDSPTLAQPAVKVEMARAFVPFSIEVGGDYVGLEAELGRLLADAKENLESEKFLSGEGSGSHEPKGILTALGEDQEAATAEAQKLAAADVYTLKQKLGARFAARSSFAAAPATLDAIYRLTGPGGEEPALLPTRDGNLLGRPTVEWSSMSSALTTTGSKVLLHGDFSAFRIVDRIGLTVELVPHLFGENRRPTGQRGLFAYWRTGSDVTIPAALAVLKIK